MGTVITRQGRERGKRSSRKMNEGTNGLGSFLFSNRKSTKKKAACSTFCGTSILSVQYVKKVTKNPTGEKVHTEGASGNQVSHRPFGSNGWLVSTNEGATSFKTRCGGGELVVKGGAGVSTPDHYRA